MFEVVQGEDETDAKTTAPRVILHPASGVDETTVALVPPLRTHRHRYFGVLAPNSPLRAAVTALAAPMQPAKAEPATAGESAPGAAQPEPDFDVDQRVNW